MEENNIFYIFLDVDGVLNNEDYIEECWNRHHKPMHMNHVPFDPKCLNNLMCLNHFLQSKGFDVKIILSSTWRLHEIDYEIVNARIAEYGMTLSGKTPYIHMERGREILDFLSDKKYKDYLVIDDEIKDIVSLIDESKIIHTEFKTGLTQSLLYKFIDYYNIMEVINDNRKTAN